jgi:heme-degrading monooxygenase HmoA
MYQLHFSISPKDMDELELGAALERVVGYLKVLLPSVPGFVTARALFSVDSPERTDIVVQSLWETWDDLVRHRDSSLSEEKVLKEFERHLTIGDLTSRAYEEIP